MKRKTECLLLMAALILALTGCGQTEAPAAAGEAAKGLTVMATNFPGYDFARAVCGEAAEVSLLLPPGTESHSYEPTPQDLLRIQESGLFIYVGGESDAWVDTILDSLDQSVPTLKMVDCVELLEEETVEGMEHEEEPAQGGVVDYDEHVWTSPANAARIVKALGEKMGELDPEQATLYAENAEAYAGEITQLDQEFRDFFDQVDNPTMVFGDRFPLRYFAEEYGLRYFAAFPGCSTQTEPSAATIAFLTDRVREEQLSTVYYIEFSNHLVADGIAEAAGAQTALFHSCHNVSKAELADGATYVSLMRGNLETLRATMKTA